jgi:2-amino-4-hydroxy-6-hydroxymethyldihydropteridine diphosphokinase
MGNQASTLSSPVLRSAAPSTGSASALLILSLEELARRRLTVLFRVASAKVSQGIAFYSLGTMKQTTYLSLGSNVGDRAKNLRDATAALENAGVRVVRRSSVYETEPVDYLYQAWFLNMAIEAETELPALDLLRALRGIETQMGSKKLVAKGPRLIDMDILLYGEQVIDTPELQVPHPRMLLRRFVLEPIAEIAPNARHPVSRLSATEMLARTPDKSAVHKFVDTSRSSRP